LAELRWILLGLGILSIGAIWWWGARRSRQAAGNPELREPTAPPPPSLGTPAGEAAHAEHWSAVSEGRWGIPPLEPLSIRTAEPEQRPAFDEPMSAQVGRPEVAPDRPQVHLEPAEVYVELPDVTVDLEQDEALQLPEAPVQPPARARPSAEHSDRHAVEAPQAPNSSETQKIVTVRVCAVGEGRWPGAALMAALESLGLAYGRYQVYHRKQSDGRSIFCVASLVEPGTFDAATMAAEEFRGVTFFAVLPGPLDPLSTLDALLATARDLARALTGTMQDAKGIPFSPQRAAVLREDVARFQALLARGPGRSA